MQVVKLGNMLSFVFFFFCFLCVLSGLLVDMIVKDLIPFSSVGLIPEEELQFVCMSCA